MKKVYSLLTASLLLLCKSSVAQVTIFSENMGSPSGTTSISANTFQNSGTLVYSGTGDVRNTTPSSGYTGASGGGNIFLTNNGTAYFQIASISTAGYSNLTLSFGALKTTIASDMSELVLQYSVDGIAYNNISFPTQPTGSGTANWRLISNISLPTGANNVQNLRLRWMNTSTSPQFRIDDITLTGTTTFYRSANTGDWSTAATWESSTDNLTWTTATNAPTTPATIHSILVRNGHTVSITSDLSIDQVTIQSGGVVNVNPQTTLSVVDGVTGTDLTIASGGSLNFLSDNTGTGRLGNLGTATISQNDNVTVQCYITGQRAYRLLAHPFSNTLTVSTTLLDDIDATTPGGTSPWIAGNNSIFRFDPTQSNGSNGATYIGVTPANENWAPGEALLTFIRGAKGEGLNGNYTSGPTPTTIDMTGSVNIGSASLIYNIVHPAGKAGWNMIGNPLPSPIQLNQITGILNADLNDFVTVYNPTKNAGSNTQNRGGYDQIQIKNSTTAQGNYVLPMCGGFYVQNQTNPEATVQISFPESCKATTPSGSLFKTANSNDLLELKILVGDTTETDNLFVRFGSSYAHGSDRGDVAKFNNTLFNFYSLDGNNQKLAVDARNADSLAGYEIPLMIVTNQTGDFNIKEAQLNLPANLEVYLKDNYISQQTQITPGFDYAFQITSDTLTKGQRFSLVFSTVVTGVSQLQSDNRKVQVMPNPANKYINLVYSFDKEEPATIVIVDIAGRKIKTSELGTQRKGIQRLDLSDIAPGAYFLQIRKSGSIETHKIIKQ